jgi:hypothetical protein
MSWRALPFVPRQLLPFCTYKQLALVSEINPKVYLHVWRDLNGSLLRKLACFHAHD